MNEIGRGALRGPVLGPFCSIPKKRTLVKSRASVGARAWLPLSAVPGCWLCAQLRRAAGEAPGSRFLWGESPPNSG